jgi:hypothetical protein
LELVDLHASYPADPLGWIDDNLQAEVQRIVSIKTEAVDRLFQIALLVIHIDCAVAARARHRLGDEKKMVYRIVRDRHAAVDLVCRSGAGKLGPGAAAVGELVELYLRIEFGRRAENTRRRIDG